MACNPDAEPDAARDSAGARTPATAPVESTAAENHGTAAAPEPATPRPDPPFRVLIEAQRAADIPDSEALQSEAEGSLPPLMLSLDLWNAPLRTVLRELARELQLEVSIAEDVPERRISLRLEESPVAEAIRQILGDIPYELVYRDTSAVTAGTDHHPQTSDAAIVAIRIFSKGQATKKQVSALKLLDPKQPKAQIEAWKKQALEAHEPRERLTALKQFLKHADPGEHEAVLLTSLQDRAPEIRVLAINSIGGTFNPPLEPISELALSDESPQVRTVALDVLLSRYGAAAVPTLEQALSDSDSGVQGTARRGLEMMQRLQAILPRPAH